MTNENDGALLSHQLRRISTIELSILIKDLQSENNNSMIAGPKHAWVKKNGWAVTFLERRQVGAEEIHCWSGGHLFQHLEHLPQGSVPGIWISWNL